MKSRKIIFITQTAMTSAFAIALSFIEMLIPDFSSFIPGGKLGLSNIAVLSAIFFNGFFSAVTVVIFKALFVFITKGLTSAILSLFGGICSCAVMYFIVKFDRNKFGWLGIGVSGAVTHNLAQITLYYLLFGKTIIYYLPLNLILALISGCVTGTVFGLIIPKILNIAILNRRKNA